MRCGVSLPALRELKRNASADQRKRGSKQCPLGGRGIRGLAPMNEIHHTKWNEYHPAPGSAWTVHDAQMPEETAPCCAACGRCDCTSYYPDTGC